VLDGVVGGVLGNQVGQDGNKVAAYDIYVRLDDGRKLIVNQRDLGSIRLSSYVSVDGCKATLIR
jgi:outer membrane lipoprotein SlyB